jgi:DNA-binding winged helix-turn-helix (wHTH) protein
MAEASPVPRIVRFGPYEADCGTGELRRDGAKVALQDKPFQILILLAQRPGELVTREELRSRLWPADTFVDFEHGLNTAVKKLRQALEDSADEPRYVETLPRRGYRFVAPVAADGSPAASDALSSGPAPPRTVARRPGSWWYAAALLALAAALAWSLRRASTPAGTVANPLPVVVLMDSPLAGRVYDPRTIAAGGTNADDITDALRDLPVVIEKENTSPMWHREAQVLRQNPDLIVSHLSCLFDERAAPGQDTLLQPLFDAAVERLISFFGYVATNNPRTRFIIYSRGRFEDYGGPDKFLANSEARFPVLHGRLVTWTVPGGRAKATFRDPETARLVRERVRVALSLP